MEAELIKRAVADIPWSMKSAMNSESKALAWQMSEPLAWEDWLKGRRARREASNRVAPEIIRLASSPSDKRLRQLFNGERGLPFTPTEKL